jgi:ferredoxin-type protein NapG
MSGTPFEKRIGDRRKFFRALFHRVSEPIAEAVERPLQQFEQVVQAGEPPPPAPPLPPYRPSLLRPPGTVSEDDFLTLCMRHQKCADVCPVQAIKFYRSDDPQLDGTPYIEPEQQACVVCQDVPCANACPSGALRPISPQEIRMGLAEWSLESCLRPMGQECRECVDKCPVGEKAIALGDDGHVVVKFDGCTGCGVCQQHCPTFPKAITVRPR